MRLPSTALVVSLLAAPVLGDTAPASLTLADALARARHGSPTRAAALARLDAARTSARLTPALPNPSVEWRTENFGSGASAALPLDVFATVTQPIELGGERRARRSRAAAALDLADADAAGTDAVLSLTVARHYLAAVRARESAHAVQDHVLALDALVRILQRRLADGVVAEADVRRLEAEQARTRIGGTLTRAEAQRELHALNATLAPGPVIALDALEVPALPLLDSADVVAGDVLAARPDVKRAHARVAAARYALDFERARRMPDLAITGGWKRTAGYNTGVLGATMPLPIFDRAGPAIAIATGELRAAEGELAQTLAAAEASVRGTLATADALREEAVRVRTALVEPAAIARTAARSAFERGAADVVRLIDAERMYAEARLMLHQLSTDAVLASLEARIALAQSPLP